VIPGYSLLLVCFLPIQSAHEAAGAKGARRSPRPLIAEGGKLMNSRETRGEIAKLCLQTKVRLQTTCCLKIYALRKFIECKRATRVPVTTRHRVGVSRRPMTGSSGGPVFQNVSDGAEQSRRTGSPAARG
jgi:hypothetical protein